MALKLAIYHIRIQEIEALLQVLTDQFVLVSFQMCHQTLHGCGLGLQLLVTQYNLLGLTQELCWCLGGHPQLHTYTHTHKVLIQYYITYGSQASSLISTGYLMVVCT